MPDYKSKRGQAGRSEGHIDQAGSTLLSGEFRTLR